ncbi:MAG: hypothetical protein ACRCXY_07875 [Fusobacteriaceae bacterium]
MFFMVSAIALNVKAYSAISKLGATAIVPVVATIPILEPTLSYKGSGISHMAFMKRDININGEIIMGITSYKQVDNGFDGVVTIKYPKSINLVASEAIGLIYGVKLDFSVIGGETDKGSGPERQIDLLVPLGQEILKSINYTISGNAPVPGKYEGMAEFTLEYN